MNEEMVILGGEQPEVNDDWGQQQVLVPVWKLLHYQRSEVERREWAARIGELKAEVKQLRQSKEQRELIADMWSALNGYYGQANLDELLGRMSALGITAERRRDGSDGIAPRADL